MRASLESIRRQIAGSGEREMAETQQAIRKVNSSAALFMDMLQAINDIAAKTDLR